MRTKYEKDFPLRAEDYARRGMTDKEIAKSLGIDETTFYRYQIKYRQFRQALKKGKAPVDVEVENALLKRARGFSYTETVREFKIDEKSDKETKTPTSIKKTRKMVVPETAACMAWLKNRRPQLWRDRHDFNLSGDMKITVITAVPRPKRGRGKGKKNGRQ